MRRVLLAALLVACSRDPSSPHEGLDAGSDASMCGTGPTQLELGVGAPFQPNPDGVYAIARGFQGGFHLDVSVRARGSLNADDTDVDLQLLEGERLLARHPNPDTLLLIGAQYCEYLNARMVFLDGEGGLMTEEAVRALVGLPLALRVDLRTNLGDALADVPVTLDAAALDDDASAPGGG